MKRLMALVVVILLLFPVVKNGNIETQETQDLPTQSMHLMKMVDPGGGG
ncbi:hypothetical protein [Bacillus sp. BPN334]|nr:hypothetical protein [Bacillus sp. BPN334]